MLVRVSQGVDHRSLNKPDLVSFECKADSLCVMRGGDSLCNVIDFPDIPHFIRCVSGSYLTDLISRNSYETNAKRMIPEREGG